MRHCMVQYDTPYITYVPIDKHDRFVSFFADVRRFVVKTTSLYAWKKGKLRGNYLYLIQTLHRIEVCVSDTVMCYGIIE